jgi:hypothetical protein
MCCLVAFFVQVCSCVLTLSRAWRIQGRKQVRYDWVKSHLLWHLFGSFFCGIRWRDRHLIMSTDLADHLLTFLPCYWIVASYTLGCQYVKTCPSEFQGWGILFQNLWIGGFVVNCSRIAAYVHCPSFGFHEKSIHFIIPLQNDMYCGVNTGLIWVVVLNSLYQQWQS